MTDPESIKLVELAFSWIELREHLLGNSMGRSPNVARALLDVEIRLMGLIAEAEQGADHILRKNLRALALGDPR